MITFRKSAKAKQLKKDFETYVHLMIERGLPIDKIEVTQEQYDNLIVDTELDKGMYFGVPVVIK